MKSLFFCLTISIVFFAGCEKSDDVNLPDNPVQVEDVQTVSRMSSDFGWNLFQELARGVTDENVLMSPISVQTALAMAVNGAAGQTRSEMLEVLGCPGCDVQDLNAQVAKLRQMMEEQSGQPTLTSANGYFYDPARISILESFEQTLTTDYKAGFQEYDFGDPATVDKINGWVKENTAGKIDKIINDIGPLDLAFLINALHFKADWATGFAPNFEPGLVFTNANGEVVDAQFVVDIRYFTTAENQDFRMVDVPFKDSTYTFSFVQPVGALASQVDWVLQLSSTDLKEMWSGLSYGRAEVFFPRLNLEYDKELKPALQALGMMTAFSDTQADFSNMGHALMGPNIYITKVRHKAVLKVDEKGAEGAAVTSVTFGTTSLPPQYTFDGPFVIVLRHTATNAILFAGLVNDPS